MTDAGMWHNRQGTFESATLAHSGSLQACMSSLGCRQLETSFGARWPLSFDQPVHALQSSGGHIGCLLSGSGS